MAQRVFIKVVGFSDEERHALNTVFRLSEQCRTMYQLWTPEAPEPPGLALLDGQSYEARLEAESPFNPDLKMLWVGTGVPPRCLRAFPRPICWPDVVEALDDLFVGEPLDLDAEFGASPITDRMSTKLALIVSPDRDERLYLRARLALARLTQADEAESGTEAVELVRDKQYDLALVGFGLPDMDAWAVLRHLREGRHAIPHVAVTKARRSLPEHLRAWLGGAEALLDAPPHPARLDAWLKRI